MQLFLFVRHAFTVSLLPIIAVTLVMGCGGGPKTDDGVLVVESRLGEIGAAYGLARAGLRRAPKSIDELKPYLKELGVADVEAAIVSPRDQKPFAVATSLPKAPDPESSPVVAFEQSATGRGRYVVRLSGVVEFLSEAEFEKLRLTAQ